MSDPLRQPAFVYLNGVVVPREAAHVPAGDRGLLYGLGFFETFRTSGGRPHHWRFNRARLNRACATAGLELPPTFLANDEACLCATVEHLLHAHGVSDAIFRYTVTAGGQEPAEMLTLRPLPAPAPETGVALRVLKLARDNGEWLPRPKSLSYANAFVGTQELARRTRVDSDEGLFLSRDGSFVVETPRQSLAWIVDGGLRYPDPALGAVAGTGLAWLAEQGIAMEPRRAGLSEIAAAEAVFVVNAVRGVTAVERLFDAEDRPLAAWPPRAHPMVTSLRRQWEESLAATAAG